jgi:hypothetical protein
VFGLYKLQHKTVLCYIHTLQSQVPSADVLGMCKLPGIILCYTYTLQSKIPFTHVLGLGNLQNKIILCYTLYTTLSVSSWQYLSQYWQALYSMSVWSYWSVIMMMQKRQFIEMLMNILWGKIIIN